MSKPTFTPGPWHVSGGLVYALHGDPQRNRFFAQPQRGRADDASYDELIANARLIAAAPDLLEACRELLDTVHNLTAFDDDYNSVQTARAAIAKATGEPA